MPLFRALAKNMAASYFGKKDLCMYLLCGSALLSGLACLPPGISNCLPEIVEMFDDPWLHEIFFDKYYKNPTKMLLTIQRTANPKEYLIWRESNMRRFK
jgi:hypothetical protein